MPSATLAESRLSMAASTATARAADNRWGVCPRSGSDGVGRRWGSVPILATCQPAAPATTVATMTAMSEEGSDRWTRGRTTITTATSATSSSA